MKRALYDDLVKIIASDRFSELYDVDIVDRMLARLAAGSPELIEAMAQGMDPDYADDENVKEHCRAALAAGMLVLRSPTCPPKRVAERDDFRSCLATAAGKLMVADTRAVAAEAREQALRGALEEIIPLYENARRSLGMAEHTNKPLKRAHAALASCSANLSSEALAKEEASQDKSPPSPTQDEED